MLLECRNCGAPLDIEEGKQTAKCRYCKASSRTDSLRTVAPTTPPNWRPPPVWLPPPHMVAPSVPLPYSSDPQRAILATTIGVMGLFFALAIGAVLLGSGRGSRGATTWNGTALLYCTDNEKLSFSDVHTTLAEGATIVATGHCEITLTRCNLSAPSPITVMEHGRIRIVGGEVHSTGGGCAVTAADDGVVLLENGATATGHLAVVAAMRAIVDARGGYLVGIATMSDNAQVLQSPAATGPSAPPPELPSAAPPRAPARPRAPVPAPPTAPTPPPGPCGCRAGDLMCAMKCSNSK